MIVTEVCDVGSERYFLLMQKLLRNSDIVQTQETLLFQSIFLCMKAVDLRTVPSCPLFPAVPEVHTFIADPLFK